MFAFGYITRLCLVFALALQLALPMAGSGKADGFNAASYLCNITGNVVTTEVEAQLRETFRLAGKDLPDDSRSPNEHCQNCIIAFVASLSPSSIYQLSERVALVAGVFSSQPEQFHYLAQGPPLGGRAPPAFG